MERKHAPMEEDDGRTIADMSGIERPMLRPYIADSKGKPKKR